METVEVLISRDKLKKRINELAEIITGFYGEKSVYAVCVLKGGAMFMVDLLHEIELPYEMNFMSVSSYADGTESSGVINVSLDMDDDLTGKNVLFVEDIVDSGRTLDFLIKRAKSRNAADVRVCTLLHKPDRTLFDIPLDFVGFEIPDEFVVGYGLDYNQKYRDLKYIGMMRFED